MGIASVMFRLASKGIRPMMKNVGGKTVLSYKNGEKHLVQMFDEAGKLEKFKIHAKDGILGGKTITKGTRKVEPLLNETVTTKVKKYDGIPLPEKTKVVSSEVVPGSKHVKITEDAFEGKYVTEVTSTKSWDGTHFGEINKRNGYTEKFDTSKTPKSPLDVDMGNNIYGTDRYGSLTDNFGYGFNTQVQDDIMRQNDDDILGLGLGLGMLLGGLI